MTKIMLDIVGKVWYIWRVRREKTLRRYNMGKYTVYIKVKAIINVPLSANSLEEAMVMAKEQNKKDLWAFDKNVECIDGKDEIIGVVEDWG